MSVRRYVRTLRLADLAQPLGSIATLAALFLSLWISAAGAAEIRQRHVTPGTTVVLAEGEVPIVATDLPTGARIYQLAAEGAQPARHLLSYTAAADAKDGEVRVNFKQGDQTYSDSLYVSRTPQVDDPNFTWTAGRLLFGMLVLAAVLESAFAVLFNWRVFLEFFDGRGVRTLVMFVSAFFLVRAFNQDYTASLLQLTAGSAASDGTESRLSTQALTALVLAGGSAGVNRLLVALNLRENKTVEQVTPKPPKDKAWVSVTVQHSKAPASGQRGDFKLLQAAVPPETKAEELPALFGVIRSREVWARFKQYFWRDVSRVPPSGGREVVPGEPIMLVVEANLAGTTKYKDMNGQDLKLTPPGKFDPLPAVYKFGNGAVVDFVVTF